ncbi:MAG TPA: LPS export ABC transporter periplasmic protein LptC [Rubricoccaceae bacterium]|nr:LPS export ABC transporter periplasmic protein LptC [Rubricoccaceae bacterium]
MPPPRLFPPLLLVGLLAAGCTELSAPPTPEELANLPDQESWGAVLRISEEGRLRVELAAPYAARYDRPDSAFVVLRSDPTGGDTGAVRVTLFDASGRPSVRVRADRLVYHDRDRRFSAEGRVVVNAPGGRRLESGQVLWDEASHRFRTPGAFRYTAPAERIQGQRLVASEDLARYSFARASGQLEVQE